MTESVFEGCVDKAHKFQGAIGEARCIYELTLRGYTIYKPLAELTKSDLVVETPEGELKRVQVKTSRNTNKYGKYEVGLVTSGGNTKVNTRKRRQPGDYDFLFVMVDDGRCWLIPDEILGDNGNSLVIDSPKYAPYELK